MTSLTLNKISQSYKEDGYYFPLRVFSTHQAQTYEKELMHLEQATTNAKLGNKAQLNYPHVIFKFANEIVRNSTILDVVESIIGKNIMVWGSTFFIKEPHSESYVSWHQDLRYWGLEDDDAMVSAWIALSAVTKANGCMRFVKGSHKNGLVDHKDSFDDLNFLTRGQQANVAIDEANTVHVELEPGEISLHHGHLLHASTANHSDERRIGLVVNYITPENRQIVACKDFAMLIRGEDKFGHFITVPQPETNGSKAAFQWHERILSAQNEAMYDGIG